MSKQQKGQQPPKVMTRRQKARWEREQQMTRRLLIIVGSVVGIAVLAVIAAVVWDKTIVPNQTVAEVGAEEITRSEYQRYREISLAQQIFQVQQQLSQYDQFLSQMDEAQREQFAAQISQQTQQAQQTQQNAVAELRTLDTASLSYQTLDQMIDEQVIIQGANSEGVSISEDEVNQALAAQFAPPPVAPEATATATSTETLTGTETVTDTSAITETAPVTPTATATIPPAEAASSVQVNLTSYYDQLKAYVLQVSPSTTSPVGYEVDFSVDEFIDYVRRQQRVELLRDAIKEKLVTEAPTSTQVKVQHILINVTVPTTATEQERELAFVDAEKEAREVLERLRAGEDFDAVAQEVSDDPGSAERGGLYDWNSPDTYVPEFKAATLEQPIGEIGEPVRTEYGWHIIKVLGREERPDESKLETARTEAFDAWLASKREELGVQRFPEPTPVPTFPVPPTEPATDTLDLTPTTPVTP